MLESRALRTLERSTPMSRRTLLVLCLAWATFCAISVQVAGNTSATFDEVPYIGAGVRYLMGERGGTPR